MCLSSSTNSSGVIYIGDGPYSSGILTYTPLILNPVNTAGSSVQGEASADYFGVKGIKVGRQEVKFSKTLQSIDEYGGGGIRISTVHPYIVMHSSIYRAVFKAFVKRMKSFIPVYPPVAPFEACYRSGSIWDVDNDVAVIDLAVDDGVNWRIWGSNSMIDISSSTTCVGFVDGGLEPASSIIIGGRQLEYNIVEFDLNSAKLRFSSSLQLRNTTSSNINAQSAV